MDRSDHANETPEWDDLVEQIADLISEPDEAAEDPRDLAASVLTRLVDAGVEVRGAPPTPTDPSAESTPAHEISRLRIAELLRLWRDINRRERAAPVETYLRIGERVLKGGEPLIAYDIFTTGLRHWKNNVRLRQQLALALARSGAAAAAERVLRDLVDADCDDDETLGILARTQKDLWETSTDEGRRKRYLLESHRLYRLGYEHAEEAGSVDGVLYNAVNAATTALLADLPDEAARLARVARSACEQRPGGESDYWTQATLGECGLILGDLPEAGKHYTEATRLAGSHYADVASTRRNASILLRRLGKDRSLLAEWFPLPSVVVFSGHLIDRPGADPRFPASEIPRVSSDLSVALSRSRAGFGYSAAACGADILFLEALRDRGGESHVVLPVKAEPFRASSVSVDPAADWDDRFREALDAAAEVAVISESCAQPRPAHFEYANLVMTGLAMLHAKALDTDVVAVTVWNERPQLGRGGTGSIVKTWEDLGLPVHVIPPMLPKPSIETTRGSVFDLADGESLEVHALLFADVVGYSKLQEEEIPLFNDVFMAEVMESIREENPEIGSANSWGDAIYMVFMEVGDAGRAALRMRDRVAAIDWTSRGFSRRLSLRIGLHAGPVYAVVDPVTDRRIYTGSHVSRAARIEPITPAGEVYASAPFAALAAATGATGFRCDYVGVTPMAKGYGDFPTYHVRRR